MTDLQRAYLDRAARALTSARLNVDAGDGEAATNRAYYACFYVVQAGAGRGGGDAEDPRRDAPAFRGPVHRDGGGVP